MTENIAGLPRSLSAVPVRQGDGRAHLHPEARATQPRGAALRPPHRWSIVTSAALAAALGAPACKKAPAPGTATAPAPGTAPATAGAAAAPTPASAANRPPIASGGRKNFDSDDSWIPAEFKSGMSKWKDPGVYVDGKPTGFLTFGELPVALKPVWIDEKVSDEKDYGDNRPGWKLVKTRRYRFTDYLQSIGINLRDVKEMHVYGPKVSDTLVVAGRELRSAKAKEFYFRFGGEVSGKPIPCVPEAFGNGYAPDKLSGVMVYIKKRPPKMIENEGMELNGRLVEGVPYFGEPIRGGVRIYLDDHYAALIKRAQLDDVKGKQKVGEGTERLKLFDFLKSQKVDTSKIVEAYVIRDDRRQEKLTRAQLEDMTFEVNSQARGQVFLGESRIAANVIAFHTRALRPEELPKILPDEES